MSFFPKPSTLLKTAKLANNPSDLSNVSQLVFPSNLLQNFGTGHFILININRLAGSRYQDKNYKIENPIGDLLSGLSGGSEPVFYSRGFTIQDKLAGGSRYTRSKESIIFPMPDSVATTYGIEWNAVELGQAGRLARELSTFGDNSLSDIGNALGEGLKNVATGAVETLTGVNVKQTAELYSGTIQNPFLEVLFKGVNTRDFNLEFKFSPRNAQESRTLSEIIRRLKFHSHPETKYRENDSSFMLYPSNFDITFMKVKGGEASRNTWLHRINTSVLVGITEDSSAGGYAPHKDDSPSTRSISLNFREVTPLRKADFESVEDSF